MVLPSATFQLCELRLPKAQSLLRPETLKNFSGLGASAPAVGRGARDQESTRLCKTNAGVLFPAWLEESVQPFSVHLPCMMCI